MLAVLVVAAGLATEPPPPPPSIGTHYLDLDLTVGGYDDFILVGPTASLGLQLGATPLWFHAAVGAGATSEIFSHGSGDFYRLSAGLEAHGCIVRDKLCLIAGGDGGVIHAHYTGVDTLTFADPPDTTPTTEVADHTVIVPRVGIDLGSAMTRFRFMVERPIDLGVTSSKSAMLVNLGVSFGW